MTKHNKGVQVELSKEINKRVVEHRNRFKRLMFNRYLEFLPLLINYTNRDSVGIDFIQLESALRQNINVVVGKARNEQIMILGYVNNTYFNQAPNFSSNFNFQFQKRLTKDDIYFIVPDYLIPDECLQIHKIYDNCMSGNFVVMQNKPIQYNSDIEIIEHYTDELSEVVLSRFSLIMQAKFSKIFKSDINDESVNQLVSEIYNGAPFVKMSPMFNADDDIIDLTSNSVIPALTEMKREYQNKISELSNYLGINSLAVDKESGVSDEEAKSNRGFTTSNSNIYLKGREPITFLSKRYGLDIKPYYDDEVTSEITMIDTLSNDESSEYNG
ncbi:collar protein [Staphylococcus phage TSP]|uniref:Collar protein n=3 Tax=Rosenblumvirus SCH1 TaxID=2732604 RepID=A0A5B8R580_9CAUD|nr:upper collar connector [Staphylococcus phage SCH1]APD20944.1 collar protein [Staphylococcus phage SCH1]APD20966.1 collar protein [Staphylococcus phage SCH111]QEA03131.1 collar protein [Staphylococcus phage vB_SauP-436A1]QQM14808.1 collar protein [Staphylococcus phage TSP]